MFADLFQAVCGPPLIFLCYPSHWVSDSCLNPITRCSQHHWQQVSDIFCVVQSLPLDHWSLDSSLMLPLLSLDPFLQHLPWNIIAVHFCCPPLRLGLLLFSFLDYNFSISSGQMLNIDLIWSILNVWGSSAAHPASSHLRPGSIPVKIFLKLA